MSALRELQRRFAAVLMDAEAPAGLEALVHSDERASAAERVAVYTEMYCLRLVEVLGEVYPRCAALLGAARFDELAHAHVRAQPSRSPTLRDYGARYCETLAAADTPAAGDLARLEWARYDVFDELDEAPLEEAAVRALPPDQLVALPLRRARASRVLTLEFEVEALYRDQEADAPRRPTNLLIWRAAPMIFHRRIEAGEAALLDRLDGALTLGALCELHAGDGPVEVAAQAVFALVGRWLADGLLVATRPAAPSA